MFTALPAAANVPANRIIETGQYSVTSEARYYSAGELIALTLVPYGDSRNAINGDLVFCKTSSGCKDAIWTDVVKANHDYAQERYNVGQTGYYWFRLRCTGGGERPPPATDAAPWTTSDNEIGGLARRHVTSASQRPRPAMAAVVPN
ncbi:hypothetical protein [Spongiactinospora gelatinilytica]|uniref:hypothetical protein n=1 Tax=Spongiactinospora gelatinilytica TaxID=2666298 RepID=UPI0011B93CAF|nr:hypothetical protein [Spongiactinospora gelatinilytica]